MVRGGLSSPAAALVAATPAGTAAAPPHRAAAGAGAAPTPEVDRLPHRATADRPAFEMSGPTGGRVVDRDTLVRIRDALRALR